MQYDVLVLYLVVVNLISFVIMGIDKAKARKHAWRISERTLFAFAIIGGSLGAIGGMYYFRHKTKHWYFVFGMPVILVLQLLIGMGCYYYFTGSFFL